MGRCAALGTCGLLVLAACAAEPEPPRRVASSPMLEPRPDWSMDLAHFLPAIRACLAYPGTGGRQAGATPETAGRPVGVAPAAAARPVGVTKAWPVGAELVGVRLLEPDDSRIDCVAGLDGSKVLLTERVLKASRAPGERDPLFTPAPGVPPQSPCLERSKIAEGWLSYDVCRDPRPIGRAASRSPSASRSTLPRNG